ncbi:LPXTG cell wall anchor domain-containing protein [Actinoplanes sp. NPDC051513]|uniref:LPXTG cell wall anchor domain-containing protein n=1 Tax=Actinoplanes sp. NPDC051513 TaxID=3363908 RepID=UPI0037B5DC0E
MRTFAFLRAAAAAAAGVATSFTFAAAANASEGSISINPGNVPATAAHYEHDCDPKLGGGPYPGKDVWVFNLPGNKDHSGSFTSIDAVFDIDGDGKSDTTVVVDAGAADGDDIVEIGHSKAYAITDAGWTLLGASATVTGGAEFFVLTHTCAAKPTTTPTEGTPTEGTPTEGAPTKGTPATTSAGPTATSEGAGGNGNGGAASGGLPITGANAGGAAALGLALIGGGTALVLRRRRRFVA